MMTTAIWTVFASLALVAVFSACIVVVVAGVRVLEHIVWKYRHRRTA
jgi:hypothetical protein